MASQSQLFQGHTQFGVPEPIIPKEIHALASQSRLFLRKSRHGITERIIPEEREVLASQGQLFLKRCKAWHHRTNYYCGNKSFGVTEPIIPK